MAKAINLVLHEPYQSDSDTDDVKTTWFLRTLTGLEFLESTQNGYVDHGMIIKRGLTGWKTFSDDTGAEIEFSVPNINRIPAPILQDISFKLQSMASLAEEERKN